MFAMAVLMIRPINLIEAIGTGVQDLKKLKEGLSVPHQLPRRW